MDLSRFKSDKRKIGVGAAILLVFLGLCVTFGIGNPPEWLLAPLTAVVLAWMGVEGYLDGKVSTTTTDATVRVEPPLEATVSPVEGVAPVTVQSISSSDTDY